MMNNKHKWAKEMQHWAAGGIVQWRANSAYTWENCHRDCVNFGAIYEFRIKSEIAIPKTRITEDDFKIFRESVAEKMCEEFSQVDLMKRLIVEVGQESIRLAIKHGDVKL